MARLQLTESICSSIKAAREEKRLSAHKLAALVGRNSAWLSRIETFQQTSIKSEEAKALEEVLDIVLCDITGREELVKKINELQAENRLLKELLMEKWKTQ